MISALRLSAIAQACFIAYQCSSKDFITQNILKDSKKQEKSNLTKSFIWGNGKYRPRENSSLQFRNFEPKLIKSFLGDKNINFKEFNFGEYHEGGIDTKGNFYIWKKHTPDATISRTEDETRTNVIQLDNSGKVKQICFSKGWAWALHDNGDVYQWQIKSYAEDETLEDDEALKFEISSAGRKIDTFKGISMISSGDDHFVALDKDGYVWTMGDDTLGQCGLGSNKRSSSPPFLRTRIRTPNKVPNISGIRRIACGSNHTLVLTNEGVVYGWGSNSSMQLSHEAEFARAENPLLSAYSPLRFEKNLGSVFVTDLAAGEEHTVLVAKNRNNGETEIFGCGKNLYGQLGVGSLSHINDIVKIESLSNYKITTNEGEKDVTIKQLNCGNNHCVAVLSAGVVLEWGANEFGELGNRKRTFSEHPIIISEFTDEEVLSVNARHTNTAVVTELNPELEKLKEEKKNKGKK